MGEKRKLLKKRYLISSVLAVGNLIYQKNTVGIIQKLLKVIKLKNKENHTFKLFPALLSEEHNVKRQ